MDPLRQKLINERYKEFRNAGDDPMNAALRLDDIGSTVDETRAAMVEYGDSSETMTDNFDEFCDED
jgi:hypothetical protein